MTNGQERKESSSGAAQIFLVAAGCKNIYQRVETPDRPSEGRVTLLFTERNPELAGNEYLVMGTLDRAVWRRSLKTPSNSHFGALSRLTRRDSENNTLYYDWNHGVLMGKSRRVNGRIMPC